ncbi:MAG: patatin-like phospholipase family protein [Pseudomonadales bacterium]
MAAAVASAAAKDLRSPDPEAEARGFPTRALTTAFRLQSHSDGRPRVVLVLSGGGARGGAHIGVLRTLESLKIPIDAIVGTSVGALVGGLYAAGLSPSAIERIATESDWVDLFNDAPGRQAFRMRRKQLDDRLLVGAATGIDTKGIRLPQGYLQGHKLKSLFRRHTLQVADIERFTELPIPFIALAADIVTGEPVLLDRGDLAGALFASMAIPAIVTPQKIDGRLLVDGGVANNLPVDVAIAMGADVIIAVDVSAPMYTPEALSSILTVTDQLTNLLTRRNTEFQLSLLRSDDVLLTPDVGGTSSMNFKEMGSLITAGVRATEYRTVELARLSVAEPTWTVHRKEQRRRQRPTLDIAEIRVEPSATGPAGLAAERLQAESGLRPGRLDIDTIQAGADRLYGLELFSEVPWRVDDSTLILAPARKSWGPNYLRAGLGFEDDLEGRSHYRLALALTATEINTLGAEWRTDLSLGDRPTLSTEFHQPFGATRAWYARPYFSWRSFTRPVFEEEDRIADQRIRLGVAGLSAGRTFGTTTDLRLTLESGRGKIERLVGDPASPGGDADTGSISLHLEYDNLDHIFFPRGGRIAALRWRLSDEALGASAGYAAWSAALANALSIGPHTLYLSAAWDRVYEDQAPFHEAFTLGGFFRLSGLPLDSLIGQERALHRAAYYYRMPQSPFAPLYVGASLEAGAVGDDDNPIDLNALDLAGSLFLGLDSPIGPVFLGGGLAEDGRGSLYIFLGSPF